MVAVRQDWGEGRGEGCLKQAGTPYVVPYNPFGIEISGFGLGWDGSENADSTIRLGWHRY
jgi:hypothetical protein